MGNDTQDFRQGSKKNPPGKKVNGPRLPIGGCSRIMFAGGMREIRLPKLDNAEGEAGEKNGREGLVGRRLDIAPLAETYQFKERLSKT